VCYDGEHCCTRAAFFLTSQSPVMIYLCCRGSIYIDIFLFSQHTGLERCRVTQSDASSPPPTSNRHHLSNGDCLEGKRENYQVCSVQYCVQQLCRVQCTHMNRLTGLWIGFCLTGPISFLCMYVFSV